MERGRKEGGEEEGGENDSRQMNGNGRRTMAGKEKWMEKRKDKGDKMRIKVREREKESKSKSVPVSAEEGTQEGSILIGCRLLAIYSFI